MAEAAVGAKIGGNCGDFYEHNYYGSMGVLFYSIFFIVCTEQNIYECYGVYILMAGDNGFIQCGIRHLSDVQVDSFARHPALPHRILR